MIFKKINSIIKHAKHLTHVGVPSVEVVIFRDEINTHLSHTYFSFLPSGRRIRHLRAIPKR